MSELKFEWDERKNRSNQKKHGVSFREAETVFADEFGRLILDPDHSVYEERFILMGVSSRFRMLIVCHCERNMDSIRIILAGKAEKFEQKQYEDYHA